MKNRQLIIIFSFIAAIVAIMAIMTLKAEEKEKPKAKDNLKFVKTIEAKLDTVPVVINTMGRVISSRNVNLTAEVQGKLEEGSISLKAGQDFSRGALLFKINDEEVKLALQSRKSNFLNAVASVLPDLKIDFKENFTNWERFFNELDVMKPIPDLPEAASVNEKTFMASRNILSEYYGIKADEERLRKYRMIAPFDGSYTNVMVEVGTVVNPGTQIARIIQHNSLEVVLPVSAEEIQLIRKGMEVEIKAEDGVNEWKGNVVRMANNVNQNTQSVDVFVKIDETRNEPLFEGMYVQAYIKAGEVTNAMLIPRKAVFDDNKIYVIKDSLLTIKEVKIHKINQESLVVSELEEGVKFVPEPLIGVVENQKVNPIQ